jgi:hypothetical protein
MCNTTSRTSLNLPQSLPTSTESSRPNTGTSSSKQTRQGYVACACVWEGGGGARNKLTYHCPQTSVGSSCQQHPDDVLVTPVRCHHQRRFPILSMATQLNGWSSTVGHRAVQSAIRHTRVLCQRPRVCHRQQLTRFTLSTFARPVSSCCTIASLPSLAARCNGVYPCCTSQCPSTNEV